MNPLRIAIVGAGGVGGLLGARLANAGHRAGFVVRRERVRALRESGLRVSSPIGDLRLTDLEVTDRALARGIVLPGLAYVASTRIGPGVIRQSSPFFRLAFGSTRGETSPVAAAFAEDCRSAGIEATLAQDILVRLRICSRLVRSRSTISAARSCVWAARAASRRRCTRRRASGWSP